MMSRFSAHNMRGLSYRPGYCAVCGRPHPEGHHVVARSLGGKDGAAETHRLWLWWHDGTDADIAPKCLHGCGYGRWAYRLSDEPCRWEEAVSLPGWRIVG